MSTNRLVHPSSAPLVSPLPPMEPIGLVPRPDAFDDPDWVFEPKYDGFRGLVYATKSGCEFRCCRDIQVTRVRDLWRRVAEVLTSHEVILDGEIVSLDRQGRPVFHNLLRGQGYLAFAAFDLLWLDGTDLRSCQLVERKRLLGTLLPEDTGPLYKILTIEEHGRALFSAVKKMDLEGIVAKCKSQAYTPETTWYKIKNPHYTMRDGQTAPAVPSSFTRRS